MLDTETKKRIDDARDILVGKVPDPKSQVEQITIALIYKFMDDMDNESVSFGGKATFFSGSYKKYSWTNIFDTKTGGKEMLELYSEAIEKLNVNPNIPQLFRDIFKNAYLPYREPETLKLFLKTINEFQYDHSEKLGDAFEYLLSVLGSQGDAGQFRTPRHIIDFIVEALQPNKNETICDPACGTAGFLISAYKHILKNNTKKSSGDQMTPDERKKIMQNITGYDISPDMVRLSLANMYLHGFITPGIHEYDTLTSEERWNEYYDIILANPPFMSPKGGIKPHKKFSIQANRSEVLFVDYIAEHIHPTKGRAGIIVPEGIIFQSGTAYKALRKMLVDKGFLYAVVSLPAGIFQPYSGVKTSILLMDRSLAKKTDSILFVMIENDGFDLGAQRRAIEKNDLTGGLHLLQEYKKSLEKNTAFESDNENVFVVEKEKIAGNSDYNLSVDRYRVNVNVQRSNFEMVRLGDVCDITSSKRIFQNEYVQSGIPFYRTKEIVELNKGNEISLELYISEERYNEIKSKYNIPKKGDILISAVGTIGITWEVPDDRKFYFKDGNLIWLKELKNINSKYLARVIDNVIASRKAELTNGAAYKALTIIKLKELPIPLPPLSIQQEIVNKIESYQKIIDGAKQIVENYKPQIDIDPEWEMVKLGEMCEFMTGGTPRSTEKEYYENGNIKWLVSGDIHQGQIYNCPKRITEKGMNNANTKFLPLNSVLIALNGQGKTRGTVAILRTKATCNQSLVSINPKNRTKLIPEFLYLQLKQQYKQIRNITGDNQRSGLSIAIIKNIEIHFPPINSQQEIISKIEKEQQLVDTNKEIIKIFEQKIRDELGKLWEKKSLF